MRRQAFASNPHRILAHAHWLIEQLQSDTDSSWSTAKAEVLCLFATLQALPLLTVPSCAVTTPSAQPLPSLPPPSSISSSNPSPPSLPPQPFELQRKGGAIVVASVARTLAKLESPPPPRNSHKCEHAQSYREMVESALKVLHAAPVDLLDPLAEELVEMALHKDEKLHEDGRNLLKTLNQSTRQKVTDKVVKEKLLGAATETAGASEAKHYTELLEALHQGKPHMLHHHTEELVKLSASGHALGADVASLLLPSLKNDAAIFSTVVEQLQDSSSDHWCPNALVKKLQLMGKLDPVELSKHDHAWLFFESCLLHPSVRVRQVFDYEMFNKESWTGALLAPHAALLLKAMENQTMDPVAAEDVRQVLRQSLVRILARLSEADLTPHVASLRGLMEREDALKVQQEMIKLPRPILAQCSVGGPLAETGSWLAKVLADSSQN